MLSVIHNPYQMSPYRLIIFGGKAISKFSKHQCPFQKKKKSFALQKNEGDNQWYL